MQSVFVFYGVLARALVGLVSAVANRVGLKASVRGSGKVGSVSVGVVTVQGVAARVVRVIDRVVELSVHSVKRVVPGVVPSVRRRGHDDVPAGVMGVVRQLVPGVAESDVVFYHAAGTVHVDVDEDYVLPVDPDVVLKDADLSEVARVSRDVTDVGVETSEQK